MESGKLPLLEGARNQPNFLICYRLKNGQELRHVGGQSFHFMCCSEDLLKLRPGKIRRDLIGLCLQHRRGGKTHCAPFTPSLPHTHRISANDRQCCRGARGSRAEPTRAPAWHHNQRPHSAPSKVWGSPSAAAGGSGRLVWVIFCLGFLVSSASSVSLSQT